MMIIGTGYFESIHTAREYYKDYIPGCSRMEIVKYVTELINNGTIKIGRPPYDAGKQRLLLDKEEGRYFLEDI